MAAGFGFMMRAGRLRCLYGAKTALRPGAAAMTKGERSALAGVYLLDGRDLEGVYWMALSHSVELPDNFLNHSVGRPNMTIEYNV